MAFGDTRALKLIYVAASGLERGFQSRSQKKALIYDTFDALLEMLGKAPVRKRAQFSRCQLELYSPNRACTDGVLTVLPSSLDLLNSVVRECRPETAEIRRLVPPEQQPAIARNLVPRSRNLEIWKSRNLELWKSGIHKSRNTIAKLKSVSPKMSARS